MNDEDNDHIIPADASEFEAHFIAANAAFNDFVDQCVAIHGSPAAALLWFMNDSVDGREMTMAAVANASKTKQDPDGSPFDVETLALRNVAFLLGVHEWPTYH